MATKGLILVIITNKVLLFDVTCSYMKVMQLVATPEGHSIHKEC